MIIVNIGYKSVEEVAKKWKCSVKSIFKWGANGLLKIWCTESLLASNSAEPLPTCDLRRSFNVLNLEGLALSQHIFVEFIPHEEGDYYQREHAITDEEIQRFEQKYKTQILNEEHKAANQQESTLLNYINSLPELLIRAKEPKTQEIEKNTQTNTNHLKMPSDHPFHASELRVAIHCWNSLYRDRDPETPSPSHGHIWMIENWLENNYKEECKKSGSFKTRISTVVNPNKKGGTPKIGR